MPDYKKLLVSLALFGQNPNPRPTKQCTHHVPKGTCHLAGAPPSPAGLCASSWARWGRTGNPEIGIQGNASRQNRCIYFPTFCRNKHLLFSNLGDGQTSRDDVLGLVVLENGLEVTGYHWLLARADLRLQDPTQCELDTAEKPLRGKKTKPETKKQDKQDDLEVKTSPFCWNIPCECFIHVDIDVSMWVRT